ncbi:MAG: hypothetical protein ACE1Z6_00305, partial [Candidatus Methylomirabilales bacterium]
MPRLFSGDPFTGRSPHVVTILFHGFFNELFLLLRGTHQELPSRERDKHDPCLAVAVLPIPLL